MIGMTVIGQDDLVAPICPPLRLERSGLESVRFRLSTIALFEVAAALRFWALESLPAASVPRKWDILRSSYSAPPLPEWRKP